MTEVTCTIAIPVQTGSTSPISIIGAGPAGVVATETLRRVDPSSDVFMLGDEPEPPYSRMVIPYLLAGNVAESGTHLRHGEAHFEMLDIDVRNAYLECTQGSVQ